ncbi:uncharacterized protein EI90DRAFT_2220276 [Cantharellus anzutake]|uniref:uncharacterized protein n=1 Tax=Cantharellus anzutake TaxID=1750568 RepID=UPI0019055A26|nr:uncharacterized protein EI90DRAFT_2220276 [Cantharellus anzutake]KAF8324899.1 hypothetical protein EI90DRAFT_2220276 [Cantharellus anzutake]
MACVECRRRKTKCDTARPICGRCEKFNRDCHYERMERPARPSLSQLEERVSNISREVRGMLRKTAIFKHGLIQRLSGCEGEVGNPPRGFPGRPCIPLYPDSSVLNLPRPTSGTGCVTRIVLPEGYGTVIPRGVIDDKLQHFDTSLGVPHDLSQHLIQVFLPFKSQFNFYIHIPRFLQCTHFPPTHPESVHPALLSAIHLAACSVGGGLMSSYEPVFLTHACSHLEQSLTHADRLIHFMWASVILGCYYMRGGRVAKAFNTISATVRFAVAAGLHGSARGDEAYRITPDSESLLAPPADAIESVERVNLWYALVLCETSISLCAGFPSSAPGDNCASVEAMLSSYNPMTHELLPSPDLRAYQSVNQVLEADLRTKSAVLLEAAKNLVLGISLTPDGSLTEGCRRRHGVLLKAYSILSQNLPDITDPRGLQPRETVCYANPELVQAHLALHACAILLNNIQVSVHPDVSSRKNVVNAAHAMARIASHIRPTGSLLPIHGHLNSIWYFYMGCEVLIREIMHLRSRMSPSDMATAECNRSLLIILDVLLELVNYYPFWEYSIKKIPLLLSGVEDYDTI